jgi:ethanolamine ammonia-lyase large subunit
MIMVITSWYQGCCYGNKIIKHERRYKRMARNTLSDLNNILFEQLERLNDDEVTGEKLTEEMNRAKSMSDVATKVISNAQLVFDAHKTHADRMNADATLPKLLEG